MTLIEVYRGIRIVRTTKGFVFIYDRFVKNCDSIAACKQLIDQMKPKG